jgi:hypothetical protein
VLTVLIDAYVDNVPIIAEDSKTKREKKEKGGEMSLLR